MIDERCGQHMRCRHGMIREWCAQCMRPDIKRGPATSSGRGVGTYVPDHRPAWIWRKREETLDKGLRVVVQ